ncbi:3468_t:CDS:2, partial [Acaulospora colombiana]
SSVRTQVMLWFRWGRLLGTLDPTAPRRPLSSPLSSFPITAHPQRIGALHSTSTPLHSNNCKSLGFDYESALIGYNFFGALQGSVWI